MDRPVVLMSRAGFCPPGLAETARADVLYSRNPFVVGRDVLAAATNPPNGC